MTYFFMGFIGQEDAGLRKASSVERLSNSFMQSVAKVKVESRYLARVFITTVSKQSCRDCSITIRMREEVPVPII